MLEIGPGTGKATRPLAERGLRVVGIELGEGLAGIARRGLADLTNVDIVTANFESWEPEDSFDAVAAFTAFHWIDPDIRFEKSARLLRAGGDLAVVETHHVRRPGGDEFWVEVQEDYDSVVPSDDNRPPRLPNEVSDLSDELEASGVFRSPAVRRYLWDVPYTAAEYIAVLDTYSGHRSMDEDARHELYRRIRRRIEDRPKDRVSKTYLAILNVARKR